MSTEAPAAKRPRSQTSVTVHRVIFLRKKVADLFKMEYFRIENTKEWNPVIYPYTVSFPKRDPSIAIRNSKWDTLCHTMYLALFI
eukprot:scaffold1228_cov246-Pinguiococcus_pyrenoidosus.AAC.9